jgi:hypothetical protein
VECVEALGEHTADARPRMDAAMEPHRVDATAVQMAMTLVYLEQMVRDFDRQLQAGGSQPQ